MTKQDKEEITEIVVTVIENVVIPVLAEHSEKLNDLAIGLSEVKADVSGLKQDMKSLKETVDEHTVSLIKLEKFTAEIYYEMKAMRLELHHHTGRIERLEHPL